MSSKGQVKEVVSLLSRLEEAIEAATDKVYQEYKKTDSFEERRLLQILENSHDYTHVLLKSRLEYLTKPVLEGNLILQENGKYTMDTIGYQFSCGSPIDIHYDDEEDGLIWLDGRIEHSSSLGGYYFFNSTHCGEGSIKLKDGMRARVRS